MTLIIIHLPEGPLLPRPHPPPHFRSVVETFINALTLRSHGTLSSDTPTDKSPHLRNYNFYLFIVRIYSYI